jgi:eukaryotic-like serine/threonine-protein kinase
MSLTAGTRLGPYEILGPLGAGGMGEVYRARDTRLGREVALKILPAEVAGDLSRRQRFELEARAVAALNHPNIVAVYDVGEGYMVSELVDGEPLRGKRFTARKTLDVAVQLAGGLAAASCIAISSPTISCSLATAGSRSSTSDWPKSPEVQRRLPQLLRR